MRHVLMIAAVVCAAFPAFAETGAKPNLPAPYETKSVTKRPDVAGWEEGRAPTAPPGFKVTKFAGDLENPRWAYELPNGDVLISEAKTGYVTTGANRLTLLRDADGDGAAEVRHVLLQDLNQPFGMA
jgi:glucose/arabinose dehydrogenase